MTDTVAYRGILPDDYILGCFKIKKILGRGGFGITYLAIDKRTNNKVAIKEYFPNEIAVRDEQSLFIICRSEQEVEDFNWGLERFVQEARLLAKFNHPNIVKVRHYLRANNTAYFVMDYEAGQSLAQLIKNGETAEHEELLLIIPHLLDGLNVIHQKNYLHRDIKPDNIIIRPDHSPVLIDFGAARYAVTSRSKMLTTILTRGYAPIEQYESRGDRQGPWTDIYAMGALLYHLISGQPLIEASERSLAVFNRKELDPLQPAIEVGKNRYPPHFLQAIDWALKINETDRPQSIAQWSDALSGQQVLPEKAIYGNFWQRLGAFFMDIILVTVLFFIAFILLMILGITLTEIQEADELGKGGEIFLNALGLIFHWLYFALSESSAWQATPGKKIFDLKVVDLKNKKISFLRASVRYVMKTLSIISVVGVLMIFFMKKKQMLHDLIVRTLVLRNTKE